MGRFSSLGGSDGVFGGLKERLGFGGGNAGGSYDADGYAGDYDASYDDDGYDGGYAYDDDAYGDDGYSSEYAGYGADYDENAGRGGYRSRSGRSEGVRLVSIDDVKADTRARARRAEGLDSLFEPTAPSASAGAGAYERDYERDYEPSYDYDGGYEPVDPASAGDAFATSYAPVRTLTVVKPVSYEEAEKVARALRAGEVAVVVLRNTPEALGKRILDFSFGAAAVLDASVECPAEQVFVLARGAALSDAEKTRLRNQGVL